MTSETRLQLHEDRNEIANLKARYVDAADGGWTGETAHDGDAVAALFEKERRLGRG